MRYFCLIVDLLYLVFKLKAARSIQTIPNITLSADTLGVLTLMNDTVRVHISIEVNFPTNNDCTLPTYSSLLRAPKIHRPVVCTRWILFRSVPDLYHHQPAQLHASIGRPIEHLGGRRSIGCIRRWVCSNYAPPCTNFHLQEYRRQAVRNSISRGEALTQREFIISVAAPWGSSALTRGVNCWGWRGETIHLRYARFR